MDGRNEQKLKGLLQAVPPGFLVDSRWLSARTYSRSSIHDYARRGWLQHVVHGLYRRPLSETIPSPDTLDMTFQSLTTLRPRRLMALLAACTSVKVKRLFSVFADRHAHAWRKHIDPAAFNLGKGDRALVKGGKLHPRYRITVPPEYAVAKEEPADGP